MFLYIYRNRFLRNEDRQLNKDSYPKLNYPEVYLLHGGYKDFYSFKKVMLLTMFNELFFIADIFKSIHFLGILFYCIPKRSRHTVPTVSTTLILERYFVS